MAHLEPFQRSTNVLNPPLNEPRAMQNLRDVHDTPISSLDVEPAGLGVCWIDQLLPFQRSARGTLLPPTLWTPTAVQTFVERHDTALSAPLPGEGTILQLAAVAGAALARHSANATHAPCRRPTIRVQFTSPPKPPSRRPSNPLRLDTAAPRTRETRIDRQRARIDFRTRATPKSSAHAAITAPTTVLPLWTSSGVHRWVLGNRPGATAAS
jgi:hypothetical protein